MSEPGLLFLDIDRKSNNLASEESRAEKPLWTRSNNNFRFNFFSEESPVPRQESSSDSTGPLVDWTSSTGQTSGFAFNFQPPADTPEEDMATDAVPPVQPDVSPPPEQPVPSKTKKKKKSGKKTVPGGAEVQKESSVAEGSQGGEETELSQEEQLKRQLDWCIEQLESGMRSQKTTSKQKEDVTRALKTLRSSKAPLAKKRQVMRTMAGDYRQKMEEEKSKQFRLIQREIASAQVKAVADAPKKSVFHRRAEMKTQNQQQTNAQEKQSQSQEETPGFVFTASNEEFRFNFL